MVEKVNFGNKFILNKNGQSSLNNASSNTTTTSGTKKIIIKKNTTGESTTSDKQSTNPLLNLLALLFGSKPGTKPGTKPIVLKPLPIPDPFPTTEPNIIRAEQLVKIAGALMTRGVGNNNPFFNMAKLLAVKGIVELAKTFVEAGMANLTVNGDDSQNVLDLKHRALLIDAKAAGLRGEVETHLQYWKDAAVANKTIEKDSHELARRA